MAVAGGRRAAGVSENDIPSTPAAGRRREAPNAGYRHYYGKDNAVVGNPAEEPSSNRRWRGPATLRDAGSTGREPSTYPATFTRGSRKSASARHAGVGCCPSPCAVTRNSGSSANVVGFRGSPYDSSVPQTISSSGVRDPRRFPHACRCRRSIPASQSESEQGGCDDDMDTSPYTRRPTGFTRSLAEQQRDPLRAPESPGRETVAKRRGSNELKRRADRFSRQGILTSPSATTFSWPPCPIRNSIKALPVPTAVLPG